MSYRLTKIYTRTGDDGKTNLGDKNRIAKNEPRVEVLGNLDELNCSIGLMLAQPGIHSEMKSFFTKVQNELFNLGGELCPPYHIVTSAEKVTALENQIDAWNELLPPLKEFVLPGGNLATASCHMARAICRRAERSLVTLDQQEKVNLELLKYVNRLSDVLFVASRVLAMEQRTQEVLWEHERVKK